MFLDRASNDERAQKTEFGLLTGSSDSEGLFRKATSTVGREVFLWKLVH
jgi:hypothetical protein